MNGIKFNHKYLKVPEMAFSNRFMHRTFLFGVMPVWDEQLSENFIEWDTRYIDENGMVGHYQLTPGRKLLLLLGTENGNNGFIMWATLRTHDIEKERKYLGQLGKQFQIILEG